MALGTHHSPLPLPVEGDIPLAQPQYTDIIQSRKVRLSPESHATRDLIGLATQQDYAELIIPPQGSLHYTYCLGLPDYMHIYCACRMSPSWRIHLPCQLSWGSRTVVNIHVFYMTSNSFNISDIAWIIRTKIYTVVH